MKFIYDENKIQIQVWQFYGIGEGKLYAVTDNPVAPTYSVQTPFAAGNMTFGRAQAKSKKKHIFYCPEVSCIETFTSIALLRQHLDLGKHVYGTTSVKQLDKVIITYYYYLLKSSLNKYIHIYIHHLGH